MFNNPWLDLSALMLMASTVPTKGVVTIFCVFAVMPVLKKGIAFLPKHFYVSFFLYF